MFTLSDWIKLVPPTYGQPEALAAAEAMADESLGWPLLRLLPFLDVPGASYLSNLMSASIGSATRPLGTPFVEGAPGVLQYPLALRAAGGQVQVDINMLSGPMGTIRRAQILTKKFTDIGGRLNRMFFTGDLANADGKQFTGVNKYCADMRAAFGMRYQIAAPTNAGQQVTAKLMDRLLLACPGANLILCNGALANAVNALETGYVKQVIMNDPNALTPALFRRFYKGVPILPTELYASETDGSYGLVQPFTETASKGGDGPATVCSRITALRIGLSGIYGLQNGPMTVAPPQVIGAFEYNNANWMMAGVAAETPFAVAQLLDVLEPDAI